MVSVNSPEALVESLTCPPASLCSALRPLKAEKPVLEKAPVVSEME